jgi:hypothetical protein
MIETAWRSYGTITVLFTVKAAHSLLIPSIHAPGSQL